MPLELGVKKRINLWRGQGVGKSFLGRKKVTRKTSTLLSAQKSLHPGNPDNSPQNGMFALAAGNDIHSFNSYFLRTHYVPGTDQGAVGAQMKTTERASAFTTRTTDTM